jgi:NTP pyrophosphatase (non-canonical NTP hydrolase)
MASVSPDVSIKHFQDFVNEVYGRPNDLHYDLMDMLSNIERFAMRGLKGIRKNDMKRARFNLLISLSWFTSTLNRLHINLEDILFRRFPYLCSYCGSCPCTCKENKVDERADVIVDYSKKPATIEGFQAMFEKIYPHDKRTLDHAGVHLAEELGEFSEALLAYRGEHNDRYLINVAAESSDVFSCFASVFNSLGLSLAKELSVLFSKNCHECKQAPCVCNFNSVVNYKS